MNDTQLSKRQVLILRFLADKPYASRSAIEQIFIDEPISKITLIRDLNYLIDQNWIKQTGAGKYINYEILPKKVLFIPTDLNNYFLTNSDFRFIRYPQFNTQIIAMMDDIFSKEEIDLFEKGRLKLIHSLTTSDQTIIKRELERYIIEFSWKSSAIEGNTYSLLETEELIKNKREAIGHDKKEAVMILNHKTTFDTILENKATFQNINNMDIRTIHTEMTKGLDITPNIRESGVGITGTKYFPLDNKWRIEESLQNILTKVNNLVHPAEKALILLAMISYLQPFTDGNKRTARMASNAILIANNYYPLSYRSIDEVEFKKALILFYEQNNLYHLKRLFLEQYRFAMQTYFV